MSFDAELYGSEFFAYSNDPKDPVSRLRHLAVGDAVHAVIGPGCSVLDIGCGPFLCGERLRELGHDAKGVDASPVAIELAHARGFARYVWCCDVVDRSLVGGGLYDAALCTETAEHLDESCAGLLVDRICGSTLRWIVWSAAHPGQPGTGHVNCQPPTYWLVKFSALGWVPNLVLTKTLRAEMIRRNSAHCEYSENFYVLERTDG